MFPVVDVPQEQFPPLLREINDPPKQLYLRGALPPEEYTHLAVVGSRKYSNYAKHVVDELIAGLRGAPISIISGLALGIDSLAHEAALRAGLYTLAVPGSGLNDAVLYPRRHRALAQRILESGGGLLSEFEPDFEATPWSFPQRNRIMAGLAHAVLVIEASERSGTLITARLATDYNRDVLTVPGDIFRSNSAGPHMLIKLGAVPVTSTEDILDALDVSLDTGNAPNLDTGSTVTDPQMQHVLEMLTEPLERDALIRALEIPAQEASALLMQMEIDGLITSSGTQVMRTRST